MRYPLGPVFSQAESYLPTLCSSDYYMVPSLKELEAWEHTDLGYCCRVNDFTVGRSGYGFIKFLGQTDVRCLNIDEIVKFHRHGVVVYEDEKDKPAVGQGLNKVSIVTLILQVRLPTFGGKALDNIVKKLRRKTERQGASFISFDPLSGEWKFMVPHFSKFGLDDEDDIMDESTDLQHPGEIDNDDISEDDEEDLVHPDGTVLLHSLPAHLRLDPNKMQEMRALMFSAEESEEFDGTFSPEKQSKSKDYARPALQYSALKMSHKNSPPSVRKTPLALLEYNTSNSNQSPPGSILMTSQNIFRPLKRTKVEGFKLDLKFETPITGSHSNNVVDAALFMGRSFRVGWGPNGILVHTGTPVGKTGSWKGLSSVINVEKVALDKVVRDEHNKVKDELIDLCFISPLELHKSINHETKKIEVGSCRLKLQKIVSDCLMLPEICGGYIGIIERKLDVPGLTLSARTILMHQVMIWELIKVLFSARNIGNRKTDDDDDEEIMHGEDSSSEIDVEALPLVRRAGFSYWLQESVCHRVQDGISCLNESSDLEHIFLLLTGRQLDASVELAASRGDVRLGCLLSQAGGSMVNRADVARQIDLWRISGLDFNFMEKDRIKLYELLAGNIQGALSDSQVDWKRYLGLLMWYQLPPDTSLPKIIDTYKQLLQDGGAPYPIPIYIDEGPLEEEVSWSLGDRFDLAYYLMLLHANEKTEFGLLKTMFSAFSSTHDALDYHMIWHQRAILEAVGVFSSNDLHVLDMSLVSQLLSVGLCHWAIYVVLQMPYRDDFPFLQANLIREILFQYCEFWSSQEIQRQFIKELDAVYFQYQGDHPKALEHFLQSCNWQKAHSIFMTLVAHSLFLSVFETSSMPSGRMLYLIGCQAILFTQYFVKLLLIYIRAAKHSEIWRIATSMEEHKPEIADWDLGAGIYIAFYHLRSSLEDLNLMSELDSLESRSEACRDFFGRLKESLAVWGSRLPVDARATYSKMAEEICCLLQSNEVKASCEVQLSCYNTMFTAPIPEDLRSCHLQEAISLFTYFLSETAS
ncbi:hypothetical protein IFM89_007122 [Coptis chinensis]|uniref:Peptidase S59 domain-containing protein n=1 Tax=Coptis chinensis TaxID=261450 RepID=A0A835HB55_9MAGN|nr:hypothetical protein IFM89_007122 [Coptis chinensis]